ncbi:hypothetical protein UFOVP1077_39 [uncultured Caudovirales phage]|uniref:Uncharacterized protein n=1 Tax=uncultured Caudovirales phage TaxID=2100421 RepID=A0A6J5QQ71_9CAUD|nr:hypothetical protein UFOVP1077_39 [uncultured Caudovirales phage]CAB4197703.1 hypothetical protein UFOVP1316_27 [uncultured Caudovirales phage]CAB4211418.1 hypothetical protein UFOVP1428_36 [uncultured Caudovirales phage]CAB5227120.1 hypothetical protein UFOVP1526_8 [uncultured Caudovirales phage]
MLIHRSHMDNLTDQELLAYALAGHSEAAFTFCRRAEHFEGMPLDGERLAERDDSIKELEVSCDMHYDRIRKLEALVRKLQPIVDAHMVNEEGDALLAEIELTLEEA